MIEYLKGLLKNLFNPAVSLLALVDGKCIISKKAKINRGTKLVNTTIDRYSYFGGGSWVVSCDIGSFCSVACDVYIGLSGHTLDLLSTSPILPKHIMVPGISG